MDAKEATPRARAAWAYTGLSQEAFSERTGDAVSYHRLRAILGPSNDDEVSLEELYAIADAAGVPRSFMTTGWQEDNADGEQPSLIELEARINQVRAMTATRDAAMQQRIRALESAIQNLRGRRQR